jgi:tRNA threonylcarbamoyladenosine biosynthesis protein TsaB
MGHRIILLETSTSLCSTALLEDGVITAERVSSEPRAHAAMTAPFVKEMLDERGLRVQDCSAVCLSMGPGSYTGLRVGSSTAKGLCFGGGIPLLAVSTLDVLVAQALGEGLPEGCNFIVPMIDARRMEVYTAVYTADGQRLTEIEPRIVEGLGSIGLPGDCTSGILFIGDGVAKCEAILGGDGRQFRQECPRASAMKAPALKEFNAGAFRDTAYFEPFYLKDFVATVGKRLF